MSETKRRIEYLPPSESEIRSFVWQVCQHLAETVDADYKRLIVINELSGFLRLVAEVECKRLNADQEQSKADDWGNSPVDEPNELLDTDHGQG